MTATDSDLPTKTADANGASPNTDWQPAFRDLWPRLERRLRFAFRRLDPESREEAVQESVCLACRAYARLAVLGRAQIATAASLARYAVAQYRTGRRVGSRLNVNDICSEHCRLRKGVRVGRLVERRDGAWRELLVEDRTVGPAELAASRLDYAAFLAGLPARHGAIAELLAAGATTSEAAARLGVSAGRVSQLRHELRAAWDQFHGGVSMPVA